MKLQLALVFLIILVLHQNEAKRIPSNIRERLNQDVPEYLRELCPGGDYVLCGEIASKRGMNLPKEVMDYISNEKQSRNKRCMFGNYRVCDRSVSK